MPPAKLGLIYSHTGLRKFIDVCGVADTASCSTSAATSTPTARRRWGSSTRSSSPRTLDERALALAAEIAANAPLSLRRQQAHHPRAARRGRSRAEVERELVELRESCFRSEDFREGVRAFGEKRKPRWRGAESGGNPLLRPARRPTVAAERAAAHHPARKRSRSARSRTTPRSRRWSSAPGRRGSSASATRPTCARSSTPSRAAAPRTAASARSRASPRPTRRCTR